MTVKELEAYLSLCRLWKKAPTVEGLRAFVAAERAAIRQ
jgi:hypothetical protein